MSRFRSDIEGLRAVAVAPVILYHYGFGFPGGFVGVDIFFVISGFLITSLLLKDEAGAGLSLPEFWERRVRRILPALTAMIVCSLVAAWFILLPRDFTRFARSLVSQMYFGSNFYFYAHTGYFDPAAETQPFLHTWSLAVEEQFYLLFPLLLLGIRKHRLRPQTILGGLAALSFALSVLLTAKYPAAAFYLLHTRAWELLIGSLLALAAARKLSRPLEEASGLAGLACIGAAIFAFNARTVFPGAAAALPGVGAALIIRGQAAGPTFVSKLLSLPPLTAIGRLSYSLYLWHWPAIVLAQYWAIRPLTAGERTLLLAAVFAASWLSVRFVETPFRRREFFAQRARLFATAATVAVSLLLIGVVIANKRGLPNRFPAAVQNLLSLENEWKLPHNKNTPLSAIENGTWPEIGDLSKGPAIDFILWGDSHAMAIVPLLESMARERQLRGVVAAHGAVAPLLDYYRIRPNGLGPASAAYNNAVLRQIRGRKIPNVILAGYWSFYEPNAGAAATDEAGGDFESAARQTIRALQETGCRIWVMLEVPDQKTDVPKLLAKAMSRGDDLNRIGLPVSEYAAQNAPFREAFASAGAEILDPASVLANAAGICPVFLDGACVYRDNSHLAIPGAMLLRPVFEPMFEKIARARP